MILSRTRNRYRYRDRYRDRIVRHSDFDSDSDFDQERKGKLMLFYAVKYHPPSTVSGVIRVIKPSRRAACMDTGTAKRPERTGDKASPRRDRAASPPGGLACLTLLSPHARSLVVFSFGFFVLAAQTLLFRDFLTVFEGSEIAVGVFFGSWLLWVGVGARLSRFFHRRLGLRFFELLPLLYIPAFILERYVLLNTRTLAGVAQYEVFPLLKMIPLAAAANMPVSLLTGAIFTLACEWKAKDRDLPVAGVYMLEAFGSFAGGLLVTLWLAQGTPAESVFIYSAFIPVVAVTMCGFTMHRRPAISLGVLIVLIATTAGGIDNAWREYHDRHQWTRLMPASGYRGTFTTPQAEYFYGSREDQFVVVSRESISATVPDEQRSAAVAAMHLAQQPQAERVLVAGYDTYSICQQLLAFPQLKQVTWLHPDPAFPEELRGILPAEHKTDDDRLRVVKNDLRQYIKRHAEGFDLAILNFPDPLTLHSNRYYTQDFFRTLKGAMTDGGVAGVSVSGGENFLGDGLIRLGATVYHTLSTTFRHVALKPGTSTWMFASDGDQLSDDTATLQTRYSRIDKAARVYPPSGLRSLFRTERAQYQRRTYESHIRDSAEGQVLNTDRNPKALVNALLLITQKTGNRKASRIFRTVADSGVGIIVLVLAVYAASRLAYMLFVPPGGAESRADTPLFSPFDAAVLIFTVGLTGMAMNTVLMVMLQEQFGSLYLFVGLVSSLFMLGLVCGSRTSDHFIRTRRKPLVCLGVLLLTHIGLILVLQQTVGMELSPISLGLFFLLGGVCTGAYFPLGAYVCQQADLNALTSGGRLEAADHLGGAAGGLLPGILLIPVLGMQKTLVLLSMFIGINALCLLPRKLLGNRPQENRTLHPRSGRRLAGVIAGGLSAVVLGAFLLVENTERDDEFLQSGTSIRTALLNEDEDSGEEKRRTRVKQVARALTDAAAGVTIQSVPREDNKDLVYAQITTDEKRHGYVFLTDRLAPEIRGYHGPITLAVYVDTNGAIKDLNVTRSREDPDYFQKVREWLPELKGKHIFSRTPLTDVDAVSGATASSRAVLRILRTAGRRFAAAVLDKTIETEPQQSTQQDRLLPPSEEPVRNIHGKPRDVNMKRLRELIERGRLSNQEAKFYKKKSRSSE